MIHWRDNQVPEPPYFANIFNYTLGDDLSGYEAMDEITLKLVLKVDGFLGYESHKSAGRGSFISYWRDKESINNWRQNAIHLEAKSEGMKRWYSYYHSMLVKVESVHFHSREEI